MRYKAKDTRLLYETNREKERCKRVRGEWYEVKDKKHNENIKHFSSILTSTEMRGNLKVGQL